ncbi:MAG TPA: hypothetical protein PK821_07800 [Victivallales bacterium]|nr:hypothetical protein [Victivallales bacterium]
MFQIAISPASGKRLIAKAVARHPGILSKMQSGKIVIIAGSTNGYVVEEILKTLENPCEFDRKGFFRGLTMPPSRSKERNSQPNKAEFPGDILIEDGHIIKSKTIFDIADQLNDGDIIIKGVNAFDIKNRKAAVLVGHPKGGTVAAAIQAVKDRNAKLILPVGLEKRISDDLEKLSAKFDSPTKGGLRLIVAPGEIISEIEAVNILSGANAELFAGGGVCGAEGSVWLAVSGTSEQEKSAKAIIDSVQDEPQFNL